MWLNPVAPEGGDANLEGSPLDRALFLGLIVAGVLVLARRRENLSRILGQNRWLFVLYAYFAASILWSDYPFISFKRWIKDLGNVVMVLVILTERKPHLAVKTVFIRLAYLLIPVSVLFIKYIPDLGRTYNHWTWVPSNVGVTTNKNELGALVMVSAIFLFWQFLSTFRGEGRMANSVDRSTQLFLALMLLWLFHAANSATSLVGAILGCGLLLALGLPAVKSRFRAFTSYGVSFVLGFVLLDQAFGVRAGLLELLGRDPTLTGRTDIWQLVLRAEINPLFGVGFYSFWLGPRAEVVWSEGYDKLNQSHNGYLETYLNGGLVGLFLLVVLLVSAYRKIHQRVQAGDEYSQVQFVLLIVATLYNFTEAGFNRMGLTWVITILAVMNFTPETVSSQDDHAQELLGGALADSASNMTPAGLRAP